jgi:hypothetical protein
VKAIAVIASLFLLATFTGRASAADLPPSCGDEKIKFDVKTQKGAPPPAGPDAGKAQLVFVETMDKGDKYHHCLGCDATTRVAVDGAWIGADHGDSYFAFPVDPGAHSVCVNWQSISSGESRQFGTLDVNAEVGGVYYFQIAVVVHEDSHPQWSVYNMMLAPIPPDSGSALVEKSALSSWVQKK